MIQYNHRLQIPKTAYEVTVIEQADAIEWLSRQLDDSVDLLLFSPPYEDARQYSELGFKLKGQAWVDWMVRVLEAASPKVKGVIAVVVEGRTRNYSYSGTPLLLGADLLRKGFTLRKPVVYRRVGIPGSGGPDWFRNDWEFVLCVTRPGQLVWSDNTVCGHEPKYGPGGSPSHRTVNGKRVGCKAAGRPNGELKSRQYKPPKLSNPGNIVQQMYTAKEVVEFCGWASGDVIDCHGGGGHLGHDLAHDNEAPFPLILAERFVKSFCPPGGVVADVMSGSGTVWHAAVLHGRQFRGCDLRADQCELARRRIADVVSKGGAA